MTDSKCVNKNKNPLSANKFYKMTVREKLLREGGPAYSFYFSILEVFPLEDCSHFCSVSIQM